jgi:transposase-like protein
MAEVKREVRRKKRILDHAEMTGNVSRTCRYFGIGRATFYRWRQALKEGGEAGLVNGRPIAKRHPNQTPPEIVEKVLHLRRT